MKKGKQDMPIHRTTEAASAPIGHPAPVYGFAPDARPYRLHRNRYGSPRWYQRWLEAWWILTGKWSLHRAWQAGKDQGGVDEWRRIIINGGDLIPIMDAAIIATRAATPNGSLPDEATLSRLRRQAWERYENDRSALAQLRDLGRQ